MNKHSSDYLNRKEQLKEAEKNLRAELEVVSGETQKSLISALKVAGITIGVLGAGYLTYKFFLSGKGKKENSLETNSKEIEKPESKGKAEISDYLSSKVATALTTTLITALAGVLSNYLENRKKDK
jgi:hypothetical protein